MGFFQNLAWATSICIDAIRRQGLAKTLRMWTTQEPEGSCRTIQTNRRCWENCMEKMGENGWHTKIVWGDLVWGFMGCFIKWKHTQQKMHIRIREVPRNYHRCVDCLIVWFPPKKTGVFLNKQNPWWTWWDGGFHLYDLNVFGTSNCWRCSWLRRSHEVKCCTLSLLWVTSI